MKKHQKLPDEADGQTAHTETSSDQSNESSSDESDKQTVHNTQTNSDQLNETIFDDSSLEELEAYFDSILDGKLTVIMPDLNQDDSLETNTNPVFQEGNQRGQPFDQPEQYQLENADLISGEHMYDHSNIQGQDPVLQNASYSGQETQSQATGVANQENYPNTFSPYQYQIKSNELGLIMNETHESFAHNQNNDSLMDIDNQIICHDALKI